jgi:hypothetical protein
MSDLSDALKRFKDNRQTSPPPECQPPTPSEVSEASEDSEVSKLVALYKSIFDRGALSDSTTKAMRDDFTVRWDQLAETKRKALVLFKGKMTSLM